MEKDELPMNPVTFGLGIRHSGSDTDNLGQIKEELRKKGVIDAVRREEVYLSLEDLVREINDHPTGLPHGTNYHVMGREGVSSFEQIGMIPLISKREEASGLEIIFGLKITQEGNPALRTPLEVSYQFEESVLPYDGLDKARIRVVFLSDEDYQRLRGPEGLANNKAAREKWLNIIKPETDARKTYFALLIEAIKNGASDIHIEPLGAGENRIRFRRDGVLLRQNYRVTDAKAKALVQVVKEQTKMNLAEHRKPLDGGVAYSITLAQEGESSDEFIKRQEKEKVVKGILEEYPGLAGYSVRASVINTTHGQSAALRILKSGGRILSLDKLGYTLQSTRKIEDLSMSPSGLILLTGPTGSGKTTTLYSVLMRLNTEAVKIVTVEDPVEINLKGISQTQVDRTIDYIFPTALRHFLRHDPDIMLVGEIRDQETAQICMEASKTGHLVLSTVHTRDAIGTLERLRALGADNIDLRDCLLGVVSQRLVRVLCPDCKEEYNAGDEINRLFGEELISKPVKLYRGKPYRGDVKCRTCDGIGYKGRTVVAEIWEIGDEERLMITQGNRNHQEYLDVAKRKGMRDLLEDGMRLVLEGKTELGELFVDVAGKSDFVARRKEIAAIVEKYGDN